MMPLLYPDWREKVAFGTDGPQPTVLIENEKMKVVLAGLKPVQKIPPHPATQSVYHFLQGSDWMTVGDERHAITAGATMIVPAGAARGIEAETELVFLAVRTP
ncbi:MAG: hypothetical protein KJ065_17315 [Anaerolineae bacterium]|nr:hypothetical protein [Anaerolineae bacterium]